MKIADILRPYKWRFAFTFALILLDGGVALLFPLFIGIAINSAVDGSVSGALLLVGLGIAALVVGAGRRFFDTRFYAVVFRDLSERTVDSIEDKSSSLKTARLGMIREIVEFMENSLPELITSIIGVVGTVVIIAILNIYVFIGCLVATVLIFLVYKLSQKRTIRLNKSLNDELERQVDVINTKSKAKLRNHLGRWMRWNIKLSDLETVNFSVSWLFLFAFLVLTIVIAIFAGDETVMIGSLFALITYVFQYMEDISNLPLHYQSWLRLSEIKGRLETMEVKAT